MDCFSIIKEGGTVLFPTDTIWGLGCDATNPIAVEKVYKIKKRSPKKSMVILLHQADQLFDYVEHVPELAFELIELSTIPLTLVFPNAKNLAYNVLADDGSIAIRICKEPLCKDFVKNASVPLVATSANLSGQKHPTNFNAIDAALLSQVDCIAPHRPSQSTNQPSKIIKLNSDGTFQIIRE